MEYKKFNDNIELIPVFLEDDNYNLLSKSNPDKLTKYVGIIGPFGTNRNEYYAPNFVFDNIDNFDKNIKFKVIGKCEKRIKHPKISYLGYIESFKEYLESISSLMQF